MFGHTDPPARHTLNMVRVSRRVKSAIRFRPFRRERRRTPEELMMDYRTREKRAWFYRALALALPAALLSGCGADSSSVTGASRISPTPFSSSDVLRPNFNLEVILRPPASGDGFGLVRFRQDNDPALVVNLDTWVRDLAPNTHYRLQRAVDATVDDNCTSAAWLTLGKGAVAQDLVTDDRGTAREDLFRVLTTAGAAFDIQFRVINAVTSAVVLKSDCYQFFVR